MILWEYIPLITFRVHIWRAWYEDVVKWCEGPISDISLANQIFYSCAYFSHVHSFLPVRINYFTYVGRAFVRIILHCMIKMKYYSWCAIIQISIDWFERTLVVNICLQRVQCWGCKWAKGTGSCLGDKVHSLLVLWKQREVDRLTKWVQALASETKYKEGIICINR